VPFCLHCCIKIVVKFLTRCPPKLEGIMKIKLKYVFLNKLKTCLIIDVFVVRIAFLCIFIINE